MLYYKGSVCVYIRYVRIPLPLSTLCMCVVNTHEYTGVYTYVCVCGDQSRTLTVFLYSRLTY